MIHIILIIGLIYIAGQKKSSTRNVILLLMGLILIICMTSKEGFELTLNNDDHTRMDGWPVSEDVSLTAGPDYHHQITDQESNTKFWFQFQATGGDPIIIDGISSVVGSSAMPLDDAIYCEVGDVQGSVGYNAQQDNFTAGSLAAAALGARPKITDYLTCTFSVDNLLADLASGSHNQAQDQPPAQDQTQAQDQPPAQDDTDYARQPSPEAIEVWRLAQRASEERAAANRDRASQAAAALSATRAAEAAANMKAEQLAMEMALADCGSHRRVDLIFSDNVQSGLLRSAEQQCCNHTLQPDDLHIFSNRCV